MMIDFENARFQGLTPTNPTTKNQKSEENGRASVDCCFGSFLRRLRGPHAPGDVREDVPRCHGVDLEGWAERV